MTQTTTGWLVFIAALGMMCGLLSHDISKLSNWNEAVTPAFVGVVMAHFGVVVTAFIGGKLIPSTESTTVTVTKTDNGSK